jgi:putative oxidoreductase
MAHRPSSVTVGRCLIAFFFIASGAAKAFAFQPSAALLAAIGFPVPQLSLVGFILIEIVGGVCLLLNVRTTYVAVALIVFLIFATLTIHAPFLRDPTSGANQAVHMIKNIAIIGGLLAFVSAGSSNRVTDALTVS